MDFSSPRNLAKSLLKLRLVDKDQAKSVLQELKTLEGEEPDLLDPLLRAGTLTPFQAECIRRLDLEMLVLGGNKLLYPNAAGSFARVFRAENIKTGKTIGVKVLRQRWAEDNETVELFRREAELGQKLKHPNIVPIFEIGVKNSYHFFSMEFVEGGNLKDFIAIRRTLKPIEALKYILDIARGLEYALSLGYTHRDMKMTNVLMTMNGVAKLIDFGLAIEDHKEGSLSEGRIQQALEYSTLEKGTGAVHNDPRSDLFFLGTILYELLIGSPPYPRTKSREERKQISRYRNIKPIDISDPSLPRSVCNIVDRLLHINPNDRYQNPAELIDDLQRVRNLLNNSTDHNKESEATSESTGGNTLTLLCVESRVKEQDILREYFSRHGFRVLMLSTTSRAIQRLKSSPPDAVLYLGTFWGEAPPSEFHELVAVARRTQIPLVNVISEEYTQQVSETEYPNNIQILTQPVSLREMRAKLHSLVAPKEKPFIDSDPSMATMSEDNVPD